MNKLKLNQNLPLIFSLLGIFMISTGSFWLLFSYIQNKNKPSNISNEQVNNIRSKINLDLPKTEECPLNGKMFTKAEKDIWEGRRPLTVSIENHLDSRPQSGLSKADVVYEAVAEGGITRFLSVFYCGVSDGDLRIGPIRSARVYFVNWASEYAKYPVFVHVGGANNICNNCPGGVKPAGQVARDVDAFRLMADLGWRSSRGNALDGGTNVGYPVVWRDYERIPGAATEHTFMGSTDKLFEEASKRGFGAVDEKGASWDSNFTKWKFVDGKASSTPIQSVAFNFWDNKPDYDVEWKYDSANNRYIRFNGGKEHTDMENKEQISTNNLIILFVSERGPVDGEGHMFYKNIGTGKALFFQNGDVITGTWRKDTREARTKFMDSKGVELPIVRGNVWIEALPEGNEVVY